MWAVRAERGLTGDDRAEFETWIAGDSRRLGAYVRAQAAWIHAERAAALGGMPEPQPEVDDSAAIADVRSGGLSRPLNRRIVIGSGGALAASLAAVYAFGSGRYRTLESGVGEIRHIALRNGARLTLDTNTQVNVTASRDDRSLDLIHGNIFVNVPKSRSAPFAVRAKGLVFQTTYGAFAVQDVLRESLTALVTEGRVLVTQSSGLFGPLRRVMITEGYALKLPLDGELSSFDVRRVAAGQTFEILAWRDGMLSFGGQSLSEAVRAFDRYGSARIMVVDPDLARQKITGLFKADDPRGFATAIAASFGGIARSEGDVIRISAK